VPNRKTGRKVGRPSTLTPEAQDLLVQALKTGAHITTAAWHAKVSPSAVFRGLRAGKEEPDGPMGEFRKSIMGAIHEAELRFVAIVAAAASSNPDRAQWMLTHRHPKRWAERSKQRMELTGQVEVKNDARERLAALLARVAKPSGSGEDPV
jgi:hypothetical protein